MMKAALRYLPPGLVASAKKSAATWGKVGSWSLGLQNMRQQLVSLIQLGLLLFILLVFTTIPASP
jgi:hypothetical protein